jgi:iron(III) transport system permease protein
MTVGSIRNSLLYSSLAVMFNTGSASPSPSWWSAPTSAAAARWTPWPCCRWPCPGLVMAFGYLAISSHLATCRRGSRRARSGSPCSTCANPTLFLVIAYSVRRLPYMVRSAVAGLQQTSVTLEEAAANLGAGPFTVPCAASPCR